jgi:DNA-binding LytR/AlgR family response regulator
MQNINCIIIDDEPLARKGLREYINDVDFLQLTGEFGDPLKAVNTINTGNVQLVFLDIQMPKITGLEFIKTMKDPPPVIFTTAFPQYALDGFDLSAIDYLVKPVSFERFFKAALKVKDYYSRKENKPSDPAPVISPGEDYFFIKVDNKLVKIMLEDILFVEALQNYVTIHTAARKFITYLTFKSVEEYLPANKFVKCHKSFIVSASHINSINGNEIMIGDHSIPVSRNNKDDVMEKLLKGKFLKR